MTVDAGPTSLIWRVQITSFVGTMAIGATHTYGVLIAPSQVVEHDDEAHELSSQKYALLRVLDEESAAELNQLNERFGRDHAIDNQPGDVTQQWDNVEQVERAAVLAWRFLLKDEASGEQSVLIAGPDDINPGKPLDGNGTLCRALLDIYERDEAAGWDYGPERERCFQEWDVALKPLRLGRSGKRAYGPGAPERPKEQDLHVDLNADTVTMEDRW